MTNRVTMPLFALLSLALLSLSLTHTHTHTLSLSPTHTSCFASPLHFYRLHQNYTTMQSKPHRGQCWIPVMKDLAYDCSCRCRAAAVGLFRTGLQVPRRECGLAFFLNEAPGRNQAHLADIRNMGQNYISFLFSPLTL